MITVRLADENEQSAGQEVQVHTLKAGDYDSGLEDAYRGNCFGFLAPMTEPFRQRGWRGKFANC